VTLARAECHRLVPRFRDKSTPALLKLKPASMPPDNGWSDTDPEPGRALPAELHPLRILAIAKEGKIGGTLVPTLTG
jgi:hypothetical protein